MYSSEKVAMYLNGLTKMMMEAEMNDLMYNEIHERLSDALESGGLTYFEYLTIHKIVDTLFEK